MKKIVLIPNLAKDPLLDVSTIVATTLLEGGFSVVTDTSCPFLHREVARLEGDALYENAHAILVLGGDGSILRASSVASYYGIPILAINLGRLGYIAQLEKNDLASLVEILSHNFDTEERAMLSVSLFRNGEPVFENICTLNDAVITKANGQGIIEFDLFCNGEKINNYRGDGMIFSTATGSTAYAMSAGGPVIDPTLRILGVTPICAHSLKARPIVFSDKNSLSVIMHDTPSTACITLDGEMKATLQDQDVLTISLSEKVTKLISFSNGFCSVLYRKMQDL